MGQAKQRLKTTMQAMGKDAETAQALLVEQAKERKKALVKPVASDDLAEKLSGEETWEQIQQMHGFRHFVLCNQETEAYLGALHETKGSRQFGWTERPLRAKGFLTLEAASAMLDYLKDGPDYWQVPLIIGALMETETQYTVIFKPSDLSTHNT